MWICTLLVTFWTMNNRRLFLVVVLFSNGEEAEWVIIYKFKLCTECDIRSCLNTLQFLHKKKVNLNVVSYLLFFLVNDSCRLLLVHFYEILFWHSARYWFPSSWSQRRVTKFFWCMEGGAQMSPNNQPDCPC